MPAVLVGKVTTFLKEVAVELPSGILNAYPTISDALALRTFLYAVYSEEGQLIEEPRQLIEPKILPTKPPSYRYFLIITDLHRKRGIPVGYYVELILINMLQKLDYSIIEIPLFPKEIKLFLSSWVPDQLKKRVESEHKSLQEEVGKDVETVGLLYQVKLNDIALDLLEGLKRYYRNDYEGSIKFFRKVVEGLKEVNIQETMMSENRLRLLKDTLKKAFHLLSNFGEHAGTYGFHAEATLSKDLAVSFSRYLTNYLSTE